MNNPKKSWILFSMLISFCFVNAQKKTTIYFGASLPLAEFASLDPEIDGAQGAQAGFNFGLEYRYPIAETNLGLIAGVDLYYNGLKKEKKAEISDRTDFIFSKYINIPVSTGLNYTFKADDKLSVFANASVAWNFLIITDEKVDPPYESVPTISYEPSNSIGFKVGGGILIKDKASLSIEYFDTASNYIRSSDQNKTVKVEVIAIKLGMKIW